MGKFVFFDIDGTLWDDNMNIPDSAKEAVKLLREKGHKTFICSGRSRANIQSEELLSMGFDGIVCACGNHIEIDGQILHELILDEELLKRTIDVVEKYKMPVVIEGPELHWISEKGFEEDPFIDYLYESMGERAKTLKGFEKGMRANKFSADIIKGTDYDSIKRELGDEYDFIMHNEMIVEAVPKGTSKGTGIKWLCNHFNVDMEDTYGIGDSANDLDMLRIVGHSIAMGNGSDVAKNAAEYITDDINNDGVYKAMKHYELIS